MLCKNDLEDDIAAYLQERIPKAEFHTVFDVGANVGWFTFQFGRVFQGAQFHLFEPVSALFNEIPKTFGYAPHAELPERATLNRMALGHEAGRVEMTAVPGVTVNHVIVAGGSQPPSEWPTESAEVMRGDDYCARHGILHIDYLKVDVEGFDMNVLHGFTGMLSRGNVDFVQVEASMAHDNKAHIHIDAFAALLACHRYRLFRIINQASGQIPYLSRADIVFIHETSAQRFS
jgi:FkbM family methyltransferase